MRYGHMNLGQDWLSQSLAAWLHQTITWANVDFSPLKFCVPKYLLLAAKSSRDDSF